MNSDPELMLDWVFDGPDDRRKHKRSPQSVSIVGLVALGLTTAVLAVHQSIVVSAVSAMTVATVGLLGTAVFCHRPIRHLIRRAFCGQTGSRIEFHADRVVTYNVYGNGRALVTDLFEPIDFSVYWRQNGTVVLFHEQGPSHELWVTEGHVRTPGAREALQAWLAAHGVVEESGDRRHASTEKR